MTPNPSTLMGVADMTRPLIGVYDVPDNDPFQPLQTEGRCVFEHFPGWLKGQATVIEPESTASFVCPGAGYWLCGVQGMPRQATADYLAGAEGLKVSPEVMCRWLENVPPYTVQHKSVVISSLRDDQYEFLKTVTFFVNPDQFAFLLTGAEYLNAEVDHSPVIAPFGSGCGQLLTMFPDLDEPWAIAGATDIAMRKHLPHDILAFTVTKPMYEQLCGLDENSFLHKTFWHDLRAFRSEVKRDRREN